MLRFIAKQLLSLILVLAAITLISFLLANISPIDPAEAYMRRTTKVATAEQIEAIRHELGFDRPVHIQYLNWLKDALRLDFGISLVSRKPVIQEVGNALPHTLLLVGITAVIVLVLSFPLGILSAASQGKMPDHITRLFSLLSVSLPAHFAGLLALILFALYLRWIPVVGNGNPGSMLIGGAVLALPNAAIHIRLLRASILENAGKDFILYARARGVSERCIMTRHLLRNALPPMVTLFGQSIGYLMAGTAVVETIFSCPGLGAYAVRAALNRDFPVINAYILVMASVFVLCNMAADIAGLMLDPGRRMNGWHDAV